MNGITKSDAWFEISLYEENIDAVINFIRDMCSSRVSCHEVDGIDKPCYYRDSDGACLLEVKGVIPEYWID